jgi:hypothetical protein
MTIQKVYDMKQNEQGFSIIEGLLVLVVLVVVSGVGYGLYNRSHTVASAGNTAASDSSAASIAPSTVLPIAPLGTTANIDDLAVQDANNESNIDSKNTSSDEGSALNTDNAATDVGGSDNE